MHVRTHQRQHTRRSLVRVCATRIRQAHASAETRAPYPVQGLRYHGLCPDWIRKDGGIPAGGASWYLFAWFEEMLAVMPLTGAAVLWSRQPMISVIIKSPTPAGQGNGRSSWPRGLILAPTRELVQQVRQVAVCANMGVSG